jgi:cbb3-type cytochrome c oxidase subunit III
VCVLAVALLSTPAWPQDGAAVYAQRCGMCHDGGVVRAPQRRVLGELAPERIVASLSADGLMRAQGAELSDAERQAVAVFLTGVIWDFDTAREFQTVNNVAAHGGSIDVGGPAIAEGVVLTTSGYPTFGGKSGNVLLAFTVEGR